MTSKYQTSTKPAISAEYAKRLQKYYFQCFFSEGSKIFIFSIIFYKAQYIEQFWTALLFLVILRTNGGGLHCKHYLSCLLLSFSILLGNIYCSLTFYLPILLARILLIMCTLFSIQLVPITSLNRPKPSQKVIWRSKRNTGIVIIFFIIITYLIPETQFVSIGFWAIIMHTCQLILAKILERRREKC